MFAIFGATGRVGGATLRVLRVLRERGAPVRATDLRQVLETLAAGPA